MVVPPLSNRLTNEDINFLASASIVPTLGHGPGQKLIIRDDDDDDQSTKRNAKPSRFSKRTAKDRALERAPVVPRKLRRYVNDERLAVTAESLNALPTTRADLKSLFERQAHTIFSTLSEDSEAAHAWAPYVDENLDGTIQYMQQKAEVGTRGGEKEKEGLDKIDRKIRHVLKERGDGIKPLVRQVEDTVCTLEKGESIVLHLPHSLSRMIAHGVAQFHSLAHRSTGYGSNRVLVIKRHNHHAVQNATRLVDVLA